jgi:hypothetical protein
MYMNTLNAHLYLQDFGQKKIDRKQAIHKYMPLINLEQMAHVNSMVLNPCILIEYIIHSEQTGSAQKVSFSISKINPKPLLWKTGKAE